ncbi:malonyl-CoA decarboxylase, partial [Mycobacterium tuberculosis]
MSATEWFQARLRSGEKSKVPVAPEGASKGASKNAPKPSARPIAERLQAT